MRYENWDILLFPSGRESKVPVKEFKVACHVVQDGEFSHSHGAFSLPVMTCFVPGLPAGTPFHISIHSWRTPEVSQFTRTYSKHTDLVKFEARILLDGRIVASTSFDRQGQWPHLINSTFEFNKAGELELLKFPQFRRELLYQNHWNPGDDIGRIKIIISEGYPRDSLSTPIERVKNVVAFSFQHAPLDILESNGIAWPNLHMWRCPPVTSNLPVPTYHPEEGSESHSHSPRRATKMRGPVSQGLHVPPMPGMASSHSGRLINPTFAQALPFLQRSGTSSGSSCPDPFTEPEAYKEWLNSLGLAQLCWSQPDATSLWSSSSAQNIMPDPMHISGPSLDEEFGDGVLKVPTNTPTAAVNEQTGPSSSTPLPFAISHSVIPGELATSLTHSLLNQPYPLPIPPHQIPLPASEVKSRKENLQLDPATIDASPASPSVPIDHLETRKFSQSNFGIIGAGGLSIPSSRVSSDSPSSGPAFSANVSRHNSGGEFGANITNMADPAQGVKRMRNFTPASAKAIDDEDEPRRPSPRVRLAPFAGDATDDN